MLRVTNIPEGITIKDLEENKWVEFIMSESVGIDDEDLAKMNEKDTVDSKRINEILTQFNENEKYEFIMVGLKYAATKDVLAEIQEIHPELKYEVAIESERSAVIKTEADKELDVMDELQNLPYVVNTAMVGSID